MFRQIPAPDLSFCDDLCELYDVPAAEDIRCSWRVATLKKKRARAAGAPLLEPGRNDPVAGNGYWRTGFIAVR